MWWHIPTWEKLRQEDLGFSAKPGLQSESPPPSPKSIVYGLRSGRRSSKASGCFFRIRLA